MTTGRRLPKYKFQWGNLPQQRILLAPCRDLLGGYDEPGPAATLRVAYGARPSEEFIRDAWPTLLQECAVNSGRDAHMAYLRGLRNAKKLRAVVWNEFVSFGETDTRTAANRRERENSLAPVPSPNAKGWTYDRLTEPCGHGARTGVSSN